jgi:hypothetical protein
MENKTDFFECTIVTAVSSNHFKSSIQLLKSLEKFNTRIVYYDLGLTNEQKDIIRSFSKVIYEEFDYTKYPKYLNVNICAGEYAWKAPIIKAAANKYKGIVIWSDSGNIFTNLDSLISVVKQNKLYSATSSGTVNSWTHVNTLERLRVDDNIKSKPMRNAACMGFDTDQDLVFDLITQFEKFSLDRDTIAPSGSGRCNHRQDQSVFSILYYRHLLNNEFDPITKYVGYSIHNDID